VRVSAGIEPQSKSFVVPLTQFAMHPPSGTKSSLPCCSWIIFVLVSCFILDPYCPAQVPPSRQPSGTKRVLILFSEAKDVPGNIMLEQALRAEMTRLSTNRLEIFPEHLDASHFSDKRQIRVFQDFIGKKYAGVKLDLILAVPSRDYTLAGEVPDALFPEVPVVFMAVNELPVPEWIRKLGVTGIVQRYDIRNTLGLIKRLQPDTRRVVVIGGRSEADRSTTGRIMDESHSVGGVRFEFWTNRPIAEIEVAVRTLPEGTVLLLSTVQEDVTGQSFFTSQLAEMLAPQASVPMYVKGTWALGSGAVGGSLVDIEELGVRGGQLAVRVLSGAHPEDLPIEETARGTPTVDWRALKRWGIKESRVPANGLIRYRPVTTWEEHKRWILISLAVFLAQAATIGALLAQRRHRRRAEAEIISQRAELAHVTRVAAMGQLTSAIAHELSQPLGAILRNAEAAELFLQKESPDLKEVRAILADIRKDDQRAGNVIERMRALLKRRSLELKPLNLGELLAETITVAGPDARLRQVSLNLIQPPSLPTVRGDRVHLQQVLLNLILNGMEAMNGGARAERVVTVKAERIGEGGVEIAVSDSGKGIPLGVLDHLFEPFFTTKPNGMGMGLAISQTIIEAHGGKLWGGNNTTRGAIFKFTVPANKN
jgi:signal transduction histidine kinase